MNIILFLDPNSKFDPANISPNWNKWSSSYTEMLFNKTESNQPDIRAISTNHGLLERCAYAYMYNWRSLTAKLMNFTDIGTVFRWRPPSEALLALIPRTYGCHSDFHKPEIYIKRPCMLLNISEFYKPSAWFHNKSLASSICMSAKGFV